jgi:phosphoribosyl 1,2-cyclic phosphate phosphodiesterase
VIVTFLGTGTSHGVPTIGCRCSTCKSTDPRDWRFRPSIWIRTDDGTSVLVDTTPDLRSQALKYDVSRVDALLLTHGHADHIMGLDDVRAYNLHQGSAIPCFADEGTLAVVRRTFAYAFDPATPAGGGVPRLATFPIGGPFCLGGMTFEPVPILHGDRLILGFRVGRFAYLTDCSAIPDTSLPLLEDLDVLVLSALRHVPHPTHFTVADAVSTAQRVGARRTLFTHMNHDLPHAATSAALPAGIELAHDGLVVEIGAAS